MSEILTFDELAAIHEQTCVPIFIVDIIIKLGIAFGTICVLVSVVIRA